MIFILIEYICGMKKILLSLALLTFALFSANAADYNIKKFGAISDTTKYSTKALQRAIDACSNAGGGRVVVPAGSYKIGSIVLKSNVNLHLEMGATLYGSTHIEDYTPLGTDFVSLRTHGTTVQLIYLLQGTFLAQGLTRLHCRQILFLSESQGSPLCIKQITNENILCSMEGGGKYNMFVGHILS